MSVVTYTPRTNATSSLTYLRRFHLLTYSRPTTYQAMDGANDAVDATVPPPPPRALTAPLTLALTLTLT